MTRDLRRGKILFIDDEEGAVKGFMVHLRNEGYTNIVHVANVASQSQVTQQEADLVYLDITGVAVTLDAKNEGMALIPFIRRHSPWTRVVVLSGATFAAEKAKSLAQADACVTKGSISLADFLDLTEEQLRVSLAPEHRNAMIVKEIAKELDRLDLGWWQVSRTPSCGGQPRPRKSPGDRLEERT